MEAEVFLQETAAVIYGVRILCVNVWEAICVHACKCKKSGFFRIASGNL